MFRPLVPKYNHRIGTILLKFSIVKVLYFWSIYIKFGWYYNGCELKIFPVYYCIALLLLLSRRWHTKQKKKIKLSRKPWHSWAGCLVEPYNASRLPILLFYYNAERIGDISDRVQFHVQMHAIHTVDLRTHSYSTYVYTFTQSVHL